MPRRPLPLLVLALALGGCGATRTVTVSSSGRVIPAAATTGTAAAARPRAPLPPDQVLASRTGQVDDGPATLDLMSLHRGGRTATATFRLHTRVTEPLDVADTFDDGIQEKVDGGASFDVETADGIFLIDGSRGVRYPVGRDPVTNACFCDRDFFDARISRTVPLMFSAVFGAPAADVASVDVFVPNFGTFTDVPLD